MTRGSYWFLTFGESEVDQVIDYCERSGIKQVMIASGSWCRSVGHYLFNETRYPHGKQGLKAVVDKLHAHGILVGMHCFVSKVSKIDPSDPGAPMTFRNDRQHSRRRLRDQPIAGRTTQAVPGPVVEAEDLEGASRSTQRSPRRRDRAIRGRPVGQPLPAAARSLGNEGFDPQSR